MATKGHSVTKLSDRTDSHDLQAKRESSFWNKSNKHLSSNYLNLNQESEEKQEFKYAKNLNNSTLSLHIAAYENSSEVDSDNSNSGENEGLKSKREGKHLIKKWSFSNEIYTGSSSLITNPFEFPRQKQEDESNPPEVMQFQASQQLRNPNEETLNNPVPASVAQPNPPLEQQQPDDREIGDEKSTAVDCFKT
uniref:Uncharacterized protein n=1 Tax=Panagrolaimus sp. ES5 TaxID=591445 RepID=A0AC34FT59_9BILA